MKNETFATLPVSFFFFFVERSAENFFNNENKKNLLLFHYKFGKEFAFKQFSFKILFVISDFCESNENNFPLKFIFTTLNSFYFISFYLFGFFLHISLIIRRALYKRSFLIVSAFRRTAYFALMNSALIKCFRLIAIAVEHSKLNCSVAVHRT